MSTGSCCDVDADAADDDGLTFLRGAMKDDEKEQQVPLNHHSVTVTRRPQPTRAGGASHSMKMRSSLFLGTNCFLLIFQSIGQFSG